MFNVKSFIDLVILFLFGSIISFKILLDNYVCPEMFSEESLSVDVFGAFVEAFLLQDFRGTRSVAIVDRHHAVYEQLQVRRVARVHEVLVQPLSANVRADPRKFY